MATTPETRPQFGPDAQRRRAHKTERAAAMKAATRAALSDDGVDTTAVVRGDPLFDGAADLAVARANAAVGRGRPLKLHERRELRSAELARQAGQQAAGQPKRRRPSIREQLEAMSSEERARAVASVRDPEVRAYVERIAEDVDIIDDAAELLAAQQTEDAWLASYDSDDEEPEALPESEWSPGMTPVEMRAGEHEAAIGDPWGTAHASLAAETAGPLYTGDAGELEDEYEYEEADE